MEKLEVRSRKSEIRNQKWRNIITPVLPGGTLAAQIGCPDEEMRSGKLMEKLIKCIMEKG